MRFAVRLLALPAAAFAAAAAPSTDSLANVAAANGHAAAIHLRATATRTFDGRRTFITIEQLGTRRLVRRCTAEVCVGSWFDGRTLAAFGLNGTTLPEDDPLTPVRRTFSAIVSYAFAEPAFREAGGSAVADGRGRWRVRAADGETLIAQLDPDTLALRRILDERGAALADYGDDVRAGGATFALKRRGLFEEPLDAVEAVPGPLEPPDGAPATFTGDPRVALADAPIPIVPCTLAGRAARCLLDTGATPSAITLPLDERLGLEPRGELEINGFSRFATGFVETGPLALGAARFAHARFAVVPAVPRANFDVVVGADLLARLHVVIDRANGFARVDAPAAEASRATLPVTFQAGVPLIDTVLDKEPARALLDTGDAVTVSLGYADYRRGPQWPVVGRTLAAGVAGATDAFFVTIPDVRLGDQSLGPTRAAVNRTQEQVHVGIGLWTRCVVDLDLPRERFGCLAR
jgi:predicted aspartyl protease